MPLTERWPETIAPPRTKQVPFEKQALAPGEEPSAEALARDPKLLTAWLEKHPERLDASQMEPGLMLSIAQLLASGGRVFEAERLLHQGLGRWPDNRDLARRWAGIAVRLNRVEAARPVLERLAPGSDDPALFYLLGVVYVRRAPRTEADLRASLAAWEKVLALSPNYRDADGSTADEIRNAIAKLKADLPPSPAPAPAPGSGSAAPPAAP